MSSCLARLGCLALIVVLLIVGWLTQDRWMAKFSRPRSDIVSVPAGWEPVNDAAAERARQKFVALQNPTGPAFVAITPGELASFFFRLMTREPKVRTDSVFARGTADRVSVRANLEMATLKDLSVFGPFSTLFGDRERLELTGTFKLIRPSRVRITNGARQFTQVAMAEFQVQELTIHNIAVPHALIPRIIREIYPEERLPGVDTDALPFAIPFEVSDIRVSNGRIILYKTAK